MKRVVIGVGNPGRGDDAVGLEVVRTLRGRVPSGVDLREATGEPTALIAAWHGADQVILIDAACSGASPGTVLRLDASRDRLPAGLTCSTHGLGLADAVALARTLDELPPRVIVFAIEATRFDREAPLSQATAAAVPAVADHVLEELRTTPRSQREPNPQ